MLACQYYNINYKKIMIDEVNVLKKGFDNEKYLKMQSEHIKERIAQFGNKLYLEFGGKLFDDYHASRVLPGLSLTQSYRCYYS